MTTAQDQPRPQPRVGINSIDAYVPGKSAAPQGVKLHKLSSNENPLGPSPKAIEAARAAAAELEFYPDGSARKLRQAIADTHSLNLANLMCFNGSDEALALMSRIYLGAGDEAVYTEHGFLAYKICILAAGATPIIAPEKDEHVDIDAILGAVTPRTKMVFLANPNNPTGTYIPFDEVRRLHADLPGHVVLILDAAYAEFVHESDYEAGAALVAASQNVVMTRTFSKAHGLGGARIGWIYAPADIIDALNRVRDPFNVTATAIAAGTASMRDPSHVERSVAHNDTWRAWLTTELTKLGLKVTPSVANFILIHFPDEAKHSAEQADAYLSARGFILRRVSGYGFPNALRMTVGTEDANRGVVAALTEFLKS